jgi:hypothetical protein
MALYFTGSDRVRSFQRLLQLDRKGCSSRQPLTIVGALQELFRRCRWNDLQLEFADEGWADTDLQRYMDQATENAPLFIEAFYGACAGLRSDDIHTPDADMINQILAKHDAGYKIEPPDLVVLRAQEPITVENLPPSLTGLASFPLSFALELRRFGEGTLNPREGAAAEKHTDVANQTNCRLKLCIEPRSCRGNKMKVGNAIRSSSSTAPNGNG